MAIFLSNADDHKTLAEPDCGIGDKILVGEGCEVDVVLDQGESLFLDWAVEVCFFDLHFGLEEVNVLEESSVLLLHFQQLGRSSCHLGYHSPAFQLVESFIQIGVVINSYHLEAAASHFYLMEEDVVPGLFEGVFGKKFLEAFILVVGEVVRGVGNGFPLLGGEVVFEDE